MGQLGGATLSAATTAGPATPSACKPAQRWNLRSALPVEAPKCPSSLPDGNPWADRANWSAATSHPREPGSRMRPPSDGFLPNLPKARFVLGPGTPSTGRRARRWRLRTPDTVPGPSTPSTLPQPDLESRDLGVTDRPRAGREQERYEECHSRSSLHPHAPPSKEGSVLYRPLKRDL